MECENQSTEDTGKIILEKKQQRERERERREGERGERERERGEREGRERERYYNE